MNLGRALIGLGVVLLVVGAFVLLSEKLPFKLGRLPGDIAIEGKNGGGFYFPITTCLLISAVLSLIVWLAGKFR